MCIWNDPEGGRSEVGPKWLWSMVKAVGEFFSCVKCWFWVIWRGWPGSRLNILPSWSSWWNECTVPNHTAFGSQSTMKFMFAVHVSGSRTQGWSILHTITRSVIRGLSAFHLRWPIALLCTACTMSGMICRYILWCNIFVCRRFNLR